MKIQISFEIRKKSYLKIQISFVFSYKSFDNHYRF